MAHSSLQLAGRVHVASNRDQLYDDLAAVLIMAAIRAFEQRGEFHLALSGGSTPEPFYMRLVTDPRYRELPWQHTHLWLVDERCVPPDDPRSNYRMIRESLADHVPLRKRQRHPMPVLADDPAGRYEDELRRAFGESGSTRDRGQSVFVPRLDFVVLGMGSDGHTASLFPHSPALAEQSRLVAVNAGPTVTPPDRMTMTYPLLNAARQVAVLVTGRAKAETLQRVAAAGTDVANLPITGIHPAAGELTWYLDADAAGCPDRSKSVK